jgi:hypothetical protein
MTLSVDATVQARTGSSRLPNKVLKPVLGKPLLQQQIERIQRAKTIDRVILATSDLPQDDPLEELANAMGIGCFRGSETDVISRVCGALEAFNIEGTEYKSTRMAWVLVPSNVTKEQVEAMLATKPNARICKKYSNKLVDVLTDEQKYALNAGIVTKEQLQEKHVIKDSQGNVVQPVQYSTGFFVNDYTNHKESANANAFGDVDMRVETKVATPTAVTTAKAVLESLM